MEYVVLFLLVMGPTLIAFLFACIVSSILGKRLYIQSGKRNLSCIFAASVFLVLFYLVSKIISVSIGLVFFNSAQSGDMMGILSLVFGVYIFAFGWVLKIAGILIPTIRIYRIKKEEVVAPGINIPLLLKATPIVAILAIGTLIGPVLSLSNLYQAQQQNKQLEISGKKNEQEYNLIIGPQIEKALSAVQRAISLYENTNKKPPEELNQLVPKYLVELPALPMNATLGGTYKFDYEVTDPMRQYYRVCVLASKFEAGLTGSKCVDQTGQMSGPY